MDGLGGITLPDCICTDAQWKMLLRVIEGLVTELGFRDRVPLMDESIMVALCNLN